MYVPPAGLRVLAEILLSPLVGSIHYKRVGEVLIASANADTWILDRERNRLSEEEFDALIISVADAEDAYVAAWEACKSGTGEWRRSDGLAALDDALMNAAEYFRRVSLGEISKGPDIFNGEG
ncbi:hypothetical protein [Streptomyces sp. NPDC029003]|uniref:hypothetical protein n=1 Tax=Streptomyces sp. NPDC029003 TaxID=3155125 RepID=UPI0033C88F4C